MPGRRINRTQVAKYMEHRKELEQEAAAAKVGISVRSARRIERAGGLPSKQEVRQWRTRTDPLSRWWESDVVPLLESAPALNAVTILEELRRRYPTEVSGRLLRTLQRRLRQWRAVHGEEREIYFAQEHPPGRLGLSDFTVANELGVLVEGRPLEHRLYQFALAYSGWRHVEVVLGGESFEALASGLQNALWQLGGVPEEHRTDSLSAAFRNLNAEAAEDLTLRYEALCADYGMRASRSNPGASHENGAIEARQGTLKERLEQALLLRGSRSFPALEQYRAFVAEVVVQFNARIAKAFAVERAALRALPPRRTAEYEEVPARVSKFGTFNVRGVLYSAPSRLVGHRLTARLYLDRVEAFVGGVKVLSVARAAPGRRQVIDYRHMLPALKRKPSAFARWRLREAMFPRTEYRLTWERLSSELPERQACRVMVGLLDLTARSACEAALAQRLGQLLDAGMLPELALLEAEFAPREPSTPDVCVQLPALASFDALLSSEVCT
ncbi:MAG TPA: IS21 family transposase [Casimicrobiaceae bacterium]|nr:IS21 family transposase [Casimicrobiaceae bacterium]